MSARRELLQMAVAEQALPRVVRSDRIDLKRKRRRWASFGRTDRVRVSGVNIRLSRNVASRRRFPTRTRAYFQPDRCRKFGPMLVENVAK